MGITISLIATSTTNVVNENITHNLIKIWDKAGVYDALYMCDGKKAKKVIPSLEKGIERMKAEPSKFKELSASNGWGTYEQALPWLIRLTEQFKEHPDAIISISK